MKPKGVVMIFLGWKVGEIKVDWEWYLGGDVGNIDGV